MLNDLRHYDRTHRIKRRMSFGQLFLIAAVIVGAVDLLVRIYGR